MVAKSPEVLNIVPKTDGNDRKEQYESSDNNLEMVKWVEKQISHELQNLNSELFFEKSWEKIIYNLNVVNDYLKTKEDKNWIDIIATNSSVYIMAIQIAMESIWIEMWKIDGVYWDKMKKWIMKFQRENWLRVDWVPGPKLLKKYFELIGKQKDSSGEAVWEQKWKSKPIHATPTWEIEQQEPQKSQERDPRYSFSVEKLQSLNKEFWKNFENLSEVTREITYEEARYIVDNFKWNELTINCPITPDVAKELAKFKWTNENEDVTLNLLGIKDLKGPIWRDISLNLQKFSGKNIILNLPNLRDIDDRCLRRLLWHREWVLVLSGLWASKVKANKALIVDLMTVKDPILKDKILYLDLSWVDERQIDDETYNELASVTGIISFWNWPIEKRNPKKETEPHISRPEIKQDAPKPNTDVRTKFSKEETKRLESRFGNACEKLLNKDTQIKINSINKNDAIYIIENFPKDKELILNCDFMSDDVASVLCKFKWKKLSLPRLFQMTKGAFKNILQYKWILRFDKFSPQVLESYAEIVVRNREWELLDLTGLKNTFNRPKKYRDNLFSKMKDASWKIKCGEWTNK